VIGIQYSNFKPKKMKHASLLYLCILGGLFLFSHCKKEEEKPTPSDVWDIEKDGIPKIVESPYLPIATLQRISRFRSSVGHDYSDAFEHCCSMKHYFEPVAKLDWSLIEISAPVTGSVTRVETEWAGTKLEIDSEKYPAFRFAIFHINPNRTFQVGDKINAGELLGRHIGNQTYSDISVIVNDPTRQGRFVSYFDVMPDSLFADFKSRGVPDRSTLIISKDEREAFPLMCHGDTFTSTDSLQSWVELR